jgi:fatty acid desaturase
MGKMMRENTSALAIMGSFILLMGLVFSGASLMEYVQNDYFEPMGLLIGVVFVLFGCVLIGKSLHARSKRTTTNV